jgi:hypothetical protein
MHAWPSVKRLQDYCEENGKKRPWDKSISRVTKNLFERGLIRKWGRGFKRSVALLLNSFFNNPILQYLIAPLFPFMAFLSFNIIYPTLSDCREGFVYRNICSFATDVTYIEYKEYLLRKRPVVSEQTHKNPESYINICGSVESCVKDRGETESFYWSRGEKIAREGLEYDVDPADTCINKRSIECLFVQGNALLEATSESFDNREYDTLWEIDMSRPVPYLTEDETWEEVYDPPVGDDYPVSPRTEPDISYPDISDEEIAVSDSDSEVEESFEYVKIQLDSVVPIMPVDTGERLISNPTKPWNAPAWRKVAGGGDVETLTEFINRVTKKKGNYD